MCVHANKINAFVDTAYRVPSAMTLVSDGCMILIVMPARAAW